MEYLTKIVTKSNLSLDGNLVRYICHKLHTAALGCSRQIKLSYKMAIKAKVAFCNYFCRIFQALKLAWHQTFTDLHNFKSLPVKKQPNGHALHIIL